jgi:uncharacterized protein YdaU (DUF1376 family)
MFYFSFHITDYRAATAHLSNEEDLAYRRLIEMYYDTEQPIPADTQWVSKRLRVGSEVIDTVLADMFELTEEGWRHARCDKEIAHYHQLAERNRANGKRGGRPKTKAENPDGSQSEPTGKPTNNHKPITNNQEPLVKAKRATRMTEDFELPVEWVNWVADNRPEVNARQTFEQFKDYWIAKAGADAAKLDWFSTWRNWVRRDTARKPAYQPVNKQAALEERNRAAVAEFLSQPEEPFV